MEKLGVELVRLEESRCALRKYFDRLSVPTEPAAKALRAEGRPPSLHPRRLPSDFSGSESGARILRPADANHACRIDRSSLNLRGIR